jgi:WD40 repeat protein
VPESGTRKTGKPLSPFLAQDEWVNGAAFSPDGMQVVTVSTTAARVWDVSGETWPAADMVGFAQLLSVQRIDDTGGVVPLRGDELSRLWIDLRAKYPSSFVVSATTTRRWREEEIRGCLREGDIRAAELHCWALFVETAARPPK